MRKTAWFFLSTAFLVLGCGSDSNPVAPAPLERSDLVGEWQAVDLPAVIEWENFLTGSMETHSLSGMRLRLTIENASYSLTATCYTGSISYEAEQWGFWEINDAASSRVRFSPRQLERTLVRELDQHRLTDKRAGESISWTCNAGISGNLLVLTGISRLFDLRADSLGLSRVESTP